MNIPDYQTLILPLLEAIGRTGDEGIDGIIKEDRLGLDAIIFRPNAGSAQ